MNKTPEEMAEEHANNSGELEDTYVWRADRDGFLAGYQAAKELYAAKLKEANDTVAGMADECEGLKTIIYDNEETNLLTPAKWISVHERLPEEDTSVLAFINYTVESEPVRRVASGAFRGGLWLTDHEILAHPLVSHWMPLPAPPEEEK